MYFKIHEHKDMNTGKGLVASDGLTGIGGDEKGGDESSPNVSYAYKTVNEQI